MEKEFDKFKTFSRRGFIIGAAQVAVVAGLMTRLGYLQIVEGEKYNTLAERTALIFPY